MKSNLFFLVLSLSLSLNFLLIFFTHRKLYAFLHTLTYFLLNAFVSLLPQSRKKVAFITHQLLILKRLNKKKVLRPKPYERLSLVVLSRKIKNSIKYQHIFTPQTLLNWHKKLVKLHWTYPSTNKAGRPGRPQTPNEIKMLILKLANDYTGKGYGKIKGELKKLGYKVSKTTIKNILKQYRIPLASKRKDSSSWINFIKHYKGIILASDFITVDTAFLKRFYVIVSMSIKNRMIHLAACTANPSGKWTTQQARHLSWILEDNNIQAKFLIRDQDSKYTKQFDNVLKSIGIEPIETSENAPLQNSHIERFIRTLREDCLDKIVIFNQKHLEYVLKEYITYYNKARPHQGLDNKIPEYYDQETEVKPEGKIGCREILGGILKDYFRIPEPAIL